MSASEARGGPLPLVLLAGAAAAGLGRGLGFPVLGLAGAAVCLGLAPGYALARWGAPGERGWLSLCRAGFLAPLVVGAVGGGVMALGPGPGFAAVLVGALGVGSAVLAARRPAPAIAGKWERRTVGWLVVLAALVLVPHALREWVRYRSDAWFHTAVTWEIAARGLPPGDPYFAGLPLNYPWFYHVVVAQWSALAGVVPWDVGGLVNAGWLLSLAGGVFALSRNLGRPAREAFFAAWFVPLGLSAAFWVWLPLKVARGLWGGTAGLEHVEHLLALTPFTFERVHAATSTWWSPPPFLNKFMVMSAFGGGVTAAVWVLEGTAGAVSRAARGTRVPGRPAALLAAAGFALWVLHPAAGLSVAPALAAAGAVLLAVPRGLPRRAVLGAAAAVAAGSLPGLGFLALCAGRAEGAWPYGFDPAAARGILVASTAALPLAWLGLRRLRPGPRTRLARLLAAALPAAALVVVLPPPNTIDKLAFLFYLVPAVAGGWFLGRLWFLARRRRGAVVAVLAVLVAPVNALYLAAYLFAPPHRSVPPADRPLYAWLAAETPPDAVILDTAERDDVLVRVPRRQYWGREPYAVQWGYPADAMGRRRLVRNVFVPRGESAADPRGPEARQAVATLTAFAAEEGVPVYLLWRPRDHDGRPAAASPAGALPEVFTPVWTGDAGTVFRLAPPRP